MFSHAFIETQVLTVYLSKCTNLLLFDPVSPLASCFKSFDQRQSGMEANAPHDQLRVAQESMGYVDMITIWTSQLTNFIVIHLC